ncbi:HAD-IA family hydrolase [Silvibacterium dinghuense]|uniref:phosphoglycolate phosphatase n=1 Tax=Silvibacterium dinghuense TaxID=1560006 RepID=A0A4V1NVF4_9BACT|nr:HAD-IA family hydrolase [Silvibacterium dinghuense]RXS95580.1 HAD family hydrolase [Silvibacterium dinghuense]GGH14176.1 haloacid dehalogenase [Silvibacterium dinghuense]
MLEIRNALPAEQIRLIVFDLDGTLIDSKKDLATSVNAMLAQLGRQELPEEIIATYIGDGAGMLVRRALGDPDDEALVEDGLRRFLDYYREHKLDHTYVYDGVFASLEELKTMPEGSPRRMAVLTNKPVNPAVAICEALGLSPYFFQIYGGNSFATKKPDPEGLRTLIAEAGVKPQETLMIGDSDVDILTARRAGAWALGCRFGLSSHTLESIPSDCLVDAASEWTVALQH